MFQFNVGYMYIVMLSDRIMPATPVLVFDLKNLHFTLLELFINVHFVNKMNFHLTLQDF